MKNLRKHGDPPYKIAVIHGGPGACGEMRTVAESISSNYGILEPLQCASSLQGQIDELKRVLLKSGTSPFILIGFSWGAWLSLLTAVQYPSIIQKVIIISCGPFKGDAAQEINKTRFSRLNNIQQGEFQSLLSSLANSTKNSSKTYLSKIKKYFNITDQYDPINKLNDKFDFKKDIFQKVWREADNLRNSGELLRLMENIRCPVVGIHGSYDPHPSRGVKQPLLLKLNDFRFIELEKCGHKPWIEKEAKNKFYKVLNKELQ